MQDVVYALSHANERWLHKALLVFRTQAPEVSLQPVLLRQLCSRSQLDLSQPLVIVTNLRECDLTLLGFITSFSSVTALPSTSTTTQWPNSTK